VFPNTNADVLRRLLALKPRGALNLMRRLYSCKSQTPIVFSGRDDGGFISDPRLTGTVNIHKTIAEARNLFPSEHTLQTPANFDSWLMSDMSDDSLCLELFPLRAKGDISLRRSRFYDLKHVFGKHPEFPRVLRSLYGNDYFKALNSANYLFNIDDFSPLSILAHRDIAEFDTMCNYVSDKLKASDSEHGWWKYVELKCLTGYRLSPWPGFDETKSTQELASSYEDKHNMLETFEHWLFRATSGATVQRGVFVGFRDWLERGDWVTAGASSVGTLEVTFMGETIIVKCRKNLVPDVLTIDELEKIAKQGKQISRAFAKNELGKVRIAVCSDLGTYLVMAWFCHVTGSSYKGWKWTTRNENGRQKRTRMLQRVKDCARGLFGMAWDYKGFERQVSLKMMKDIIVRFYLAGKDYIPQDGLAEVNFYYDLILKSFNSAILIAPDGTEFDVTGSLQSGLFITSATGDGVSMSATQAAMDILEQLGFKHDIIIDLQGDDVSYLSTLVSQLQLIDWILDAMNFKAGTGKFGITSESTEFLRVSISSKGCQGYIARAIPGLSQRKPWTDSPPTKNDEIINLIDAAHTVHRRGGTDNADAYLRIWTRKNKISYVFARTPLVCNGLGLDAPLFDVRYPRVAEKVIIDEVKVFRKTQFRERKLLDYATKFGFTTTKEKLEIAANIQCSRTVSLDNVPKLRNLLRDAWDKQVIKSTPTRLAPLMLTRFPILDVESSFGKFDYAAGKLEPLLLLEISKHDAQAVVVPELLEGISKMSNLTRPDAENWLTGGLPVYTGSLNPIITEPLTNLIASQIKLSLVPKSRLIDVWVRCNLTALQYIKKSTYSPILYW
jgi:hypothetical protein